MDNRTRATVVVAGCGFAGSAAACEIARLTRGNVDVIAYDKQHSLYNYPVLPRLLNESLPSERVEVPLDDVLHGTGVALRHERVEAIDPSRQLLQTSGGRTRYDYLIVAPGSRAVPLVQDDGLFVFYPKALRHLRQLVERIDAAVANACAHVHGQRVAAHRIAVVGGGLSGVEFAMAIREAANRRCDDCSTPRDAITVSLFESDQRLHPLGPERLSRALARELNDYGIRVALGQSVLRATHAGLLTRAGTVPADTVVCCIGSQPHRGIHIAGLDPTSLGIGVDAALRCRGHGQLFVIGDGMLFGDATRPRLDLRQAHRATEQGRHAARNIHRLLRGEAVRPYRPRELPVAVMLQSRRGAISYRGLCITGRLAGRAKRWLELRHT